MRILLTNDDGIHATGIAVLARVAERFGEVWVVAPDTERSGVSHAITLFKPLRLKQIQPRWFACDGTPTDCIYLALHQMQIAPDLVLSGVNAGPNLAHDVLYSGTVSGALEGAHWGVPSLAISHCNSKETDIAALEPMLGEILTTLLPTALELGGALNVNLPSVHRAPYAGIAVTSLGRRYYSNEVIERNDPRGQPYYWIGGAKVTMPDLEGSDCNAIRDNLISVTPLGDDLTRHASVSRAAELLAHHGMRPATTASAPDPGA
jgi:5'-nucleotidase